MVKLQDEVIAIDEDEYIPIIGMTYYNPFLIIAPQTQPLLEIFNDALRSVYLDPQFKNVYLADVALPFDSVDAILDLTLIFTCGNIHPNDEGYWQIADTFINAIVDNEILDDDDDDDDDGDDDDDDDED